MSRSEAYCYCAAEMRRFDYDRYLAALFAPRGRRPALFALGAFNLEVAKTREMVSEPLLGQMRLQWWRESLDGIYAGAPRRHEVVTALADTVTKHGLKRAPFDRLLETRELDLTDEPPATMKALVDYAEGTSGTLARQIARVLAPGDEAAADAAGRAGTAWALTGLVRAIPFHARARRCYVPRDVMAETRLTETAVYSLKPSAELARAAEHIANAAEREAEAARPGIVHGGKALRSVAAMLALNDLFLARLHAAGYDVYSDRLAISNAKKQLHLTRRAVFGRMV